MEAPTFIGGVHAIMNCNVTEYPDTINTLKRFNLYPEVSNGRLRLDPGFSLLLIMNSSRQVMRINDLTISGKCNVLTNTPL